MTISVIDIKEAHKRIEQYIHRTPVFTSTSINSKADCDIYFKFESLQKAGAFKIRGAMNAALQLPAEILKRGIATHSSGNHAQAIALAARILNTKAFVVMPNNSPIVKINAVKEYGAEITFCEPFLEAREETTAKVIKKSGAHFIHPFNDEKIIAGQATCAKEFIEDITDLDIIVTPVGGGGLLSGTSLSAKYFGNNIDVYASEPVGAADAILSFKTGKVEKASYINTIADGLLTTLGDITLKIIRENVKDILTVKDEEIISALKLVYERMKMIIEPSSAAALALVLKEKKIFRKRRIGVIISGGNVDLNNILSLF